MDSDDDDCLRIVDDEELETLVQTNSVGGEEIKEPARPAAVKEEATAGDEQKPIRPVQQEQRKSRLPASLRNRIARSNARSSSLLVGDEELKILRRPNKKSCAVTSCPRINAVRVIKEECCDFETALKELSADDSVCSAPAKKEGDQEVVFKDEPIAQSRTNSATSFGTNNSIVGRKLNAFSHPRLRKGDRLTKLIDPMASTAQIKRRTPKVPKKTSATGDLNAFSAGLSKKFKKKISAVKNKPEKAAWNIVGAIAKRKTDRKNLVGEEGLETKVLKLKEASKRRAKITSQGGRKIETIPKKAKAEKQTKATDVPDSDEEDFFYSLKPSKPIGKETTLHDEDDEAGGTEKHLTRAGRRRLTRSLLREGKRMVRPRKVTSYAVVRKRMSRIHCPEQEGGIETFDSFLKIPVIRVKAVEDFVFAPNDRMKHLYEDFQVNVLGEGLRMDFTELKKKAEERVRILEQKIAEAECLRAEYEREDVLGTEPFLDALAYRRHPKVTRGDRAMNTSSSTFDMLASQLRFNSCALTELRGVLCRVRPLQPLVLCRGNNKKCPQVAAYLDDLGGMSEQARLRNCKEIWKLEGIIEEKIKNVKSRMKGIRSQEQPAYAETERIGTLGCSDWEKNYSFDHESGLNLVNDDILCVYDSTKFGFIP